MAAVRVALAPSEAGGLVSPDDDLTLPGPIEVCQSRSGVGAVRVEERPAGQRRTVARVEGVADLAEGPATASVWPSWSVPTVKPACTPTAGTSSVDGFTTGVNQSCDPDEPKAW